MKNIKRILAIVAIVLLLSMYVATLVFSLIGSEQAQGWFRASLACTIIVPVLLYAFILVYKNLKNK